MGLDPNIILQFMLNRRAREEEFARQQGVRAQDDTERRRAEQFNLVLKLAEDPNFKDIDAALGIAPDLTPPQANFVRELNKAGALKAKAGQIATGAGAAAAAAPIGGGSSPETGYQPTLAEVLDSLRSVESQSQGNVPLLEESLRGVDVLAQENVQKSREAELASERIGSRQKPPDVESSNRADEGLALRKETLRFRKRQTLATTWDKLSKDYRDLDVAVKTSRELAGLKTRAGDVELIYSLAKANDPRVSDRDVAIREAAAGNLGDQARRAVSQMLGPAGKMPDDIRQRMLDVVDSKAKAQQQEFRKREKRFRARILREGFDADEADEIMVSSEGVDDVRPAGSYDEDDFEVEGELPY